MHTMLRGLFALLAIVGASSALAQTNDPGAWYHEQVRRNQSGGIVGSPPITPPPVGQGPGLYFHDETRQRQLNPQVAPPRTPLYGRPAPMLRERQRIVRPQRPPDPVRGSGGNRARTRGGG